MVSTVGCLGVWQWRRYARVNMRTSHHCTSFAATVYCSCVVCCELNGEQCIWTIMRTLLRGSCCSKFKHQALPGGQTVCCFWQGVLALPSSWHRLPFRYLSSDIDIHILNPQTPSARFRINPMPLIMLCSSYLNVVQPKLRLYEGLLAPPTAYTICFQLLFHEHAPALIFPAAVGSLISTQRSRGVLYENLGSR